MLPGRPDNKAQLVFQAPQVLPDLLEAPVPKVWPEVPASRDLLERQEILDLPDLKVGHSLLLSDR